MVSFECKISSAEGGYSEVAVYSLQVHKLSLRITALSQPDIILISGEMERKYAHCFDTFVSLGQKMFEKKTGNRGGRVAYDVSLDKSNERF